MKFCGFIICMGLFFMGQVVLWGQTQTFYEHGHKIEHFTEKDGLPSYQVNGIHQGESGYLWIATPDGILKHDGYSYERINLSEKIITNTLQDYMAEILEQKNGDVVIGALSGGLIRYNPNEKIFKRFVTGSKASDFAGTPIYEDSLGNIWTGTVQGLLQLTSQDSLIHYGLKSIEPNLDTLLSNIENHKLVGQIKNPKRGTKNKIEFEISRDSSAVQVLCISRVGKDNKLVDYGWIENQLGEKVWEINLSSTINAGGNYFFNRANLEKITLLKGTYSLHYFKEDEEIPNYQAEYLESYANNVPIKTQGIFLLEGIENNSWFEKIKTDYEEQVGLKDDFVPYIFIDKHKNIWTYNTHLSKIQYENGKINFKEYCTPLDSIKKCPCQIVDVRDKNENQFWIVGQRWTNNNEFIPYIGFFDKETGVFQEIKTNISTYNKNIYSGPVRMSVDAKGNLWIGTGWTSLYKVMPPFVMANQEGNPNTVQFKLNKNSPNGHVVSIRKMTIDNNDNLWFGTQGNGLYKLDLKKASYHYFEFPDSIKADKLFKMREDSENNIWLNEDVSKNTLYKVSNNFKNIEKYQNTFKGVPFERFMSPIAILPDGNHLFKSLKEFVVYNPKKDSIMEVISSTATRGAGVGHSNTFVINDSLLYINNYIFNFKTWTVFKEFDSYLNGRFFSNGIKGNNENFWLGAYHGNIGKFRINGDKLDTIQISNNQAYLAGLVEDKEGNCWISTGYGLQGFLNGSYLPTNFSKVNGNYTNLYGNIFLDNQNNIWAFPVSGIVKFSIKDSTIIKIHSLKGIDITSLRSNIIQNNKGDFRVLGAEGIYTFHPDSLVIDSIAPKIVVEAVYFFDKNEEKSLKSYSNKSSLSFNYQQNDLNFEYVGINFNNSELITYAYQMQGLSNDWQQVGKERTARFLDLPPGNYTFKVKAANVDGIWSEPKSIKITINPPWWQTLWAYLIYALSFIGVLYYWYRSVQQKLKKEQAHNQELTAINEANQRFVPNDFLQILGKDSIKDLKLGDQTHTKMTVLFSDIRDYTPLSESMTPEENFQFINAYLGRIGPIIKAHGGFISSYLGDGLMALFVNEPENAIAATIAMQKELEAYNRARRAEGKRPLHTGMGLNTGDLMLGVIGDEHRYESTVISDAVNTASRMEGLTKVFGAAIILSERTMIGLNVSDTSKVSDTFGYRYLGKVKVKGKDKALKIYDLYEGEPVATRELKAQTKAQFEQGIQHYFNRQFGKAAECFKEVLVVNNRDKAAEYYLEKSVNYIVNGVAEEWNGVEEMVMK